MFERDGPRLFALPPGVDFAERLVAGLRARLTRVAPPDASETNAAPDAMARIEIYVNTDRMARRLRQVFDAGPPTLLPQIRLVTDLADPLTRARLPAPASGLRRRLELTRLVQKLLDNQPDLAARSALYDLSDSLAALMEEMQGEGVAPETIAALDVSDQSGHWQRAQQFFSIVQSVMGPGQAPDVQGFNRAAMEARLAAWETDPPKHPIIVAGSTGSRGTTAAFMRAVARLPQGAVVLPGFDFDMPQAVWDQLDTALTGEDHPQFRFARLMDSLGLSAQQVVPWDEASAPAPARNKALSLALRPAPVTHQWLAEGPALPDLVDTMADVTLVQAPSPRDEAQAIALRLRQAAHDGTRAALITPDRMLTRQVTAALSRWGIIPDDSAGIPAQLTPPGRLLRHVATLFEAPLSAEALLTLLKHPLTHAGDRDHPHGLNTADLELYLRRKGLPYPTVDDLRAFGTMAKREAWAGWLAATVCGREEGETLPLETWVARHHALAEALVAGTAAADPSPLWDENAGRTVRAALDGLAREADAGPEMTARDYAALFGAILSREEVRDRDEGHPDILIWGTLEARVMDAELLILSGLNEGSWPESPPADPWLNRALRHQAGLLLPERRVGLSAHDFQQAMGARRVWLTRSLRSTDAETVPSRWLNRLTNLMTGLPGNRGPEALAEMIGRGDHWLRLARLSEQAVPVPLEPRPSPAPPKAARPLELPVTQIKTLIRDPYATYVRYVLRLRPLDPLMRAPDALLRGILTHDILETYVRRTLDDPSALTAQALINTARETLSDPRKLPYPTVRALWHSRIARVADWFARTEAARQQIARPDPRNFETKGAARIDALGFTLTAKADRIDIDSRGGAHVYDYKTGKPPTSAQQKSFDKQLLLEAAMLLRGGFNDLAPSHVARALFIGMKPGDAAEVPAPLDEVSPGEVWEQFVLLMTAYADPARGYTARAALLSDNDRADYDHLSRFGEWDVAAPAVTIPLTMPEDRETP
ncbi:double-strand break repair protein AddB [Cognatishimia sp. F0-27]|uniref:double-strand break repair protein AddB n=1 Tax=Cognatishimia sp. F0-27 TaxID=2816855 RepID=UPI001DFD2A88|nr:double-strand break repair protein AddB [Cognatishimia sp. F0-27]